MNARVRVWGIVFSLVAVAVGQAVTFTEDTKIASDDYTYDGSDVIVDGCGLTIDGAHGFSSFEIINGGWVTHAAGASLELDVAGDMVIDDSAWIYLDGKGYGSDSGPGAGVGRLGYRHGGGAGHGGSGGDGSAAGGDIYGSADKPSTLGSGGGKGFYTGQQYAGGGQGGGAIKVIVNGTLTLNGTLSTNGTNGARHHISGVPGQPSVYWSGGGGSGGSVWIQANTLAGDGSITADGGNGGYTNSAGGGGGGRIAIYYNDATGFEFLNLSVQGGTGREDGELGTICLNGEVQGQFSVYITAPANDTQFQAGETVTFQASATLDQPPTIYTWTSSRDGELGHGESLSVSTLSVGQHLITLSGVDSTGATDEDDITIEITEFAVAIDEPSSGSEFTLGEMIQFSASQNDGQEPVTYTWTSSINGLFGEEQIVNVSTLDEGHHVITLTGTDDTGAVADCNITIDVLGPDLIVDVLSMSPNPAVQCAGDATISWAVKNQGQAVAAPNGYSLAIRLSDDPNYDDWDTLICRSEIDVNLPPGETVSGICPLDPNAFEPGNYYLVARGDVEGFVAESDEGNNDADPSMVSIVEPSVDCWLDISSTDGGSVVSPGQGVFTYPCGTCVDIKAEPEPCYRFDHWSGSAVDPNIMDPCDPEITVCLINDEDTPCNGVTYDLKAHFVWGDPPDVKTLGADEMTATTVRLNGEIIDDGEASCEGRFRYWEQGNPPGETTTWQKDLTTSNKFNTYVTGLAPATTYEFSAEAQNPCAFTSATWLSFRTWCRLRVSATEGGVVAVADDGLVTYPEEEAFEYADATDVAIATEATDLSYIFWCWTGSAADKGKVADVNDPATTVLVDDDDTLRAAFLLNYCPDILLDPAPCRGTDGSTSQCWSLGDGHTEDPGKAVYDVTGWPIDGLKPRPGTFLKCTDEGPEAYEQWWAYDEYWGSERQGLFSTSGLRANIHVWPSDELNTVVYVHLVWHESDPMNSSHFAVDTPYEPVFSDFQPSTLDEPVLIDEIVDSNGWHHGTYTWSVSPSHQWLAFTLRGQIVIDALVIESCSESCCKIPVDDGAVGVYRLWSSAYQRHFYTIDEAEREALLQDTAGAWQDEGIAYYAFADDREPNVVPVYRFYAENTLSYFYTINETEKDKLIENYSHWWAYQGVGFYVYAAGQQPADTSPVYRFWSDVLGYHFYTISESEKDKLIENYPDAWTYEGVAWYAYK